MLGPDPATGVLLGEGSLPVDGRGELHAKMEAERGVVHLQAKGAKGGCKHRELERGRAACPWRLRRNQPCRHLDLTSSLLSSEGIKLCCFKLPGLWHFVLVALGN